MVRTYCHELTFPLPQQRVEVDREVLSQFGRKVFDILADTVELEPAEREKVSKERVRSLVATHFGV
jgi:hypothetical protein